MTKDEGVQNQGDCAYRHEQRDSLGPDERNILGRYKLDFFCLSERCYRRCQKQYQEWEQASPDTICLAQMLSPWA